MLGPLKRFRPAQILVALAGVAVLGTSGALFSTVGNTGSGQRVGKRPCPWIAAEARYSGVTTESLKEALTCTTSTPTTTA
jgi:hypothetical protein